MNNLDQMSDADLKALRTQVIKDKVTEAATKYGIDPNLSHIIVNMESNYDPTVVSPKGAIGVMQLMPATAKGYNADPYNADENIDAGHQLLKNLMDKYNDPYLSAIAYNAGPKYADQYLKTGDLSVLPTETLNYLKKLKEQYTPAQPEQGEDDFQFSPNPFADEPDQPLTTQSMPIPQQSATDLEKLGAASGGIGTKVAIDYLTAEPVTPEIKAAQTALDNIINKKNMEDFIKTSSDEMLDSFKPPISIKQQHILEKNDLKTKQLNELFNLQKKYNVSPSVNATNDVGNFFRADKNDVANTLLQGSEGQGLQKSLGFGDARKLAEINYKYGLEDVVDKVKRGILPADAIKQYETNFGIGNTIRTPQTIILPQTIATEQAVNQLNASTPEAKRTAQIAETKNKKLTEIQQLKLKQMQEMSELQARHAEKIAANAIEKQKYADLMKQIRSNKAVEWATINLDSAMNSVPSRLNSGLTKIGNFLGKYGGVAGGAIDAMELKYDLANKDYGRAALSGAGAGLGALSLMPRLSNPAGLGTLGVMLAKNVKDSPEGITANVIYAGQTPDKYRQDEALAKRTAVRIAQPNISGLEYLINR